MQRLKKDPERTLGWTVYLVKCADGSYFSGMCRNLKKTLSKEISRQHGVYFVHNPERLPVTVVFEDAGLIFREAYAKFQYIRNNFDRSMKERLIRTKRWPVGGPYREYMLEKFKKELKP